MPVDITPTMTIRPSPGTNSWALLNHHSLSIIDAFGLGSFTASITLPSSPVIGQEHTIVAHRVNTNNHTIKVKTAKNRFDGDGDGGNEIYIMQNSTYGPFHTVYNEVKGAVLTGTYWLNNYPTESTLVVTPTAPWTLTVGSYNIKVGDLVQITSGTHSGDRRRVRSCAGTTIVTDPFDSSGSDSGNCEVHFTLGFWSTGTRYPGFPV